MTITASPTSTGSSRDERPRRRWPRRLAAVGRMALGLIFLVAGLPRFSRRDLWLGLEPAALGIGCLLIAVFGAGAWQPRALPAPLELRKRRSWIGPSW